MWHMESGVHHRSQLKKLLQHQPAPCLCRCAPPDPPSGSLSDRSHLQCIGQAMIQAELIINYQHDVIKRGVQGRCVHAQLEALPQHQPVPCLCQRAPPGPPSGSLSGRSNLQCIGQAMSSLSGRSSLQCIGKAMNQAELIMKYPLGI